MHSWTERVWSVCEISFYGCCDIGFSSDGAETKGWMKRKWEAKFLLISRWLSCFWILEEISKLSRWNGAQLNVAFSELDVRKRLNYRKPTLNTNSGEILTSSSVAPCQRWNKNLLFVYKLTNKMHTHRAVFKYPSLTAAPLTRRCKELSLRVPVGPLWNGGPSVCW